MAAGILPPHNFPNAAHVAVSAVHAVDYLLTWNCKHLAQIARPNNTWEHSIMWKDPIVAEVHRTREKLAAQDNFDIAAFFADVRKRQAALGERLVHQK